MADYWKSIPRKFCEFCKCWLTDNKPSVEFHERGRRHQENVKRRIGELRKKGKKEFTAQSKLNMQMSKINEAAMKAFQKDLIRDPALVKQLQSPSAFSSTLNAHADVPTCSTDNQTKELVFPSGKSKQKTAKKLRAWMESKDEIGRKYYWNSETGESTWEPPAEGYLSLFEQEIQQSQTLTKPVSCSTESSDSQTDSAAEKDGKTTVKREPYGQWLPITQQKEAFDLQLPVKVELSVDSTASETSTCETAAYDTTTRETAVYDTTTRETAAYDTVTFETSKRDALTYETAMSERSANEKNETKVKFKEKTVATVAVKSESDGNEVVFKKRKLNDVKRNVRKRLEDN